MGRPYRLSFSCSQPPYAAKCDSHNRGLKGIRVLGGVQGTMLGFVSSVLTGRPRVSLRTNSYESLNPEPQTLNPKPQTLNPKP